MTEYSTIHDLIDDWYGMPLPITIRTRDQEIAEFEKDHPEIPAPLWDFVNHNSRLITLWLRSNTTIELLVRRDGGEIRFLQDVCFKDAYPTPALWHRAMKEMLEICSEVWVVRHAD